MQNDSDFKILFCVKSTADASTVSYLNVLERIPGIELIMTNPISKDFDWNLVDESNFIIFLREIREQFMEVQSRARLKGIKTAYATDDNLCEYGKVNKVYQEFSSPKVLEALKNTDYIFCSNQNLCNYYQNLTKGRSIVLPANVPKEELPLEVNPSKNKITLGFFGNQLGDAFNIAIKPLKEINLLRPQVEFFSGGVDLNNFGIKSTYLKFNPYYKTALAEVKKFLPQIMIAPNSEYTSENIKNPNIEYKCIAKLVDATQMGAILVASNIGPFKDLKIDEGVMAVNNTEAEWTSALLKTIDDEELRQNLFTKARNYLLEYHESSKIAQEIGKIIIDSQYS